MDAVVVKQMNAMLVKQDVETEREQDKMAKKSATKVSKTPKAPKKLVLEPEEIEEEVATSVTDTDAKPFAEDAHEFLKILGKWVWLKSTHPSGYNDYHEATRKWLEKFKDKK